MVEIFVVILYLDITVNNYVIAIRHYMGEMLPCQSLASAFHISFQIHLLNLLAAVN